MRRALLVGLALLLSLLIAGCQQVAEKATQKAIEQTTGVKVETDSVPAELKDLPIPGGFTYDGGGSVSKDGDKVTSASWKGQGTTADVTAFFKKEMPGRSWKEEAIMNSDDSSLLNYSKDDQSGIMITVSKEGNDDVTIAVIYGKSSKTPTPEPVAETSSETDEAVETPVPDAPEPTATAAAPETTDNANIAPQLKAIPVPGDFKVEQDSFQTISTNGKLGMATARWFGKAEAKQAFEFFQKEIPAAGWTEIMTAEDSDGYSLAYNGKDELNLMIEIRTLDTGTEIEMILMPE